MSISNFGKEDFQQLLEAWGSWAAGLGCNLNAVSGTQLLWAKSSRGTMYSEMEMRNVEKSMLDLQSVDPYLYEIIKYRYYGGEQRSIRVLELRFRISTRKAEEYCLTGESLARAFYCSLKKAA